MVERVSRSGLLWSSAGLMFTALIWGTMTPLLKVLTEEPLFAGLAQDEQDALQGLLKRALSRAEILQA